MPAPLDAALTEVRGRLGASIMRMVAGPEPSPPRGLAADDTERRFPAGSPISTVHGDASMFVGGLSALLLQALHPLAMAGVADHSDYRDDPWGRLARTSHFLARTTFGTVEEAEAAVAAVRAVHRRVRGVAPDGRPYAASDPHLVEWVHVAELASFLRAHRRYGATRLTRADEDRYDVQAGEIALELGAGSVPATVTGLRAALNRFRPELEGTSAARDVARYLLLEPPRRARGQDEAVPAARDRVHGRAPSDQRIVRVIASPPARTTVASVTGSHGSRRGQRAQRGSRATAAAAIGA